MILAPGRALMEPNGNGTWSLHADDDDDDEDDHDDIGVTLRRSPGVMRRIHTAPKWKESTASLNKTDNTESPSGKNPHGTEAEIIHNITEQNER